MMPPVQKPCELYHLYSISTVLGAEGDVDTEKFAFRRILIAPCPDDDACSRALGQARFGTGVMEVLADERRIASSQKPRSLILQ